MRACSRHRQLVSQRKRKHVDRAAPPRAGRPASFFSASVDPNNNNNKPVVRRRHVSHEQETSLRISRPHLIPG